MEEAWTWIVLRWADFEAWSARPLSNGTLFWAAVLVIYQTWANTNRVQASIEYMHDDLTRRMPKPGHFEEPDYYS